MSTFTLVLWQRFFCVCVFDKIFFLLPTKHFRLILNAFKLAIYVLRGLSKMQSISTMEMMEMLDQLEH